MPARRSGICVPFVDTAPNWAEYNLGRDWTTLADSFLIGENLAPAG